MPPSLMGWGALFKRRNMFSKMVNALLISHANTGNKSYTTTMVVYGFAVINLKLLFSGIQLTQTIKLSDFSGVDYAAAIAALGGIHLWNNQIAKKDSQPEQEK